MKYNCFSLISVAMLLVSDFSFAADYRIVTTGADYKPYSFVDESNAVRGLYRDIIAGAADSIAVSVSFTAMPWRRASAMTRAGRTHGIFVVYKTPLSEKDYWIVPGAELGDISYKVCLNKKNLDTPIPKISDLVISSVLDYEYLFADKIYQQISFQSIARSETHLAELLVANRVAAGIFDDSLHDIMQSHKNIYCYPDKIKGSAEYVAFSKKLVTLEQATKFSRAVKNFKSSKDYKQLLKFYELEETDL